MPFLDHDPTEPMGMQAITFGPTDGRRTLEIVGWGALAFGGAGTVYASLAMFTKVYGLVALVAAAVAVAGAVGLVFSWRRKTVVDGDGVHVTRFTTRHIPWSSVERVRTARKFVQHNQSQGGGYGLAAMVASTSSDPDYMDLGVILLVSLRNGKELPLHLRAQSETISAQRLQEIAQALDSLREEVTRRR